MILKFVLYILRQSTILIHCSVVKLRVHLVRQKKNIQIYSSMYCSVPCTLHTVLCLLHGRSCKVVHFGKPALDPQLHDGFFQIHHHHDHVHIVVIVNITIINITIFKNKNNATS